MTRLALCGSAAAMITACAGTPIRPQLFSDRGCGPGAVLVRGGPAGNAGDLCVDRTEVTLGAFRKSGTPAVAVDWAGITEEERSALAMTCNAAHTDREDHPVNCVDLTAAEAFCQSRGARLPSTEEWLWIALGGRRTYPWGESTPTPMHACITFDDAPRHSSCPAGRFPDGATPEGVLDLAGNLWEWTSTVSEGSPTAHVILGGAFNRGTDALTPNVRAACPVGARTYKVGFRCVSAARAE